MSAGSLLAPFLFSPMALSQAATAEPGPKPAAPGASTDQWAPQPVAPTPSAQPAAGPQSTPTGATPEPPPLQPAPTPQIQLATQAPAPAPVVTRTDKTHDGFYTRVSFGFGSQSTTLDDARPFPNFEATKGALVFNVLIGGAPAPGIVIGGSLALDSLPSTTFRADDGAEVKTGVNLLSVGPFIDGYPNPRGGFHLGGTVGPSVAKLTTNVGFGNKATGVGLAAWLGYDWWVADQWSVGGLLRFSGANTWSSGDAPKLGSDVRSISLLVTAVYQ